MAGTDFSHLTTDELIKGIKALNLPEYIRSKAYGVDVRETLAQMTEMLMQLALNQGMTPQDAQDWVSQLNNKIIKGQVTMSDLTQEVKEALTGGAVAVVGVDAVGTENIKDKAVDLSKISFVKTTENLFDGTIFADKFVSNLTGNLNNSSPAGQYAATDFIPVNGLTHISSNWFSWTVFYDENKNYITGYADGELPSRYTLELPAGTYFARTTIDSKKVPFDKFIINGGQTPLPYRPRNLISNEVVEKEEITVDFMKDTEYVPLVFKKKPRNIFNKNKVTTGYYLNSTNGVLVPSENYSVSDMIEIDAGKKISFNVEAHKVWLNEFGNYIGSSNFTEKNNITPPPTTKYLRTSVSNSLLDNMMIVYGNLPTVYEPHYSDMSAQLIDKLNIEPKDVLARYMKHDPFSFTQKLIGDSITHGMGGTGFATDGEVIPGTNVKMNSNGHSWANSYRDLMQNYVSSSEYFNWDNEYVNILSSNQNGNSASYIRFLNDRVENLVSFRFKGDKFSVSYQKFSFAGIFEVYIDGLLIDELDTYSTTGIPGVTTDYTVEWGTHEVVIKATNRANASATGKDIVFEGVYVYKQAKVKNYAQSGINSQHVIDQLDTLIEPDDDVIIMQIGTNDRGNRPLHKYKENLRKIIGYIRGQGKDIILMSPPPTAVTQDNERDYFRTFDVDQAIRQIANEYNLGYVSNYDSMFKYSEYTGTSIDDMLSDGLHPNDLGYDVIFHELVRVLDIHYPREGILKAQ